jgi:asparagine synthase (glutamine-hydrolysing)
MASTLQHRGPDDSGVWVDAAAGFALGFRRLSIIDLSPSGHQPMVSSSGRWVLVFNGEIYSFRELRDELAAEGHVFRGRSDSEVILEACEEWGVEAALKRFIGMFAMALWDRKERKLYLVRDRLGIKPLYYGWAGPSLVFGSELKALRAHPLFEPNVDRDALALFMRHNYVPAPYSIYSAARKLLPGHLLCITQDGVQDTCYWDARKVAADGLRQPLTGGSEEIREELDFLLRDAVKRQMVADVPLGVFLSGGIDSSTVVALMQAQSAAPVRSFSIGFRETDYNEAEYARQVAKHLGTDHADLYVTPAETLDVIPRLPDLYDEPFGDSSQIPTFVVSQLTRRHVAVALSGDGGDELFAGYDRYFWTPAIWSRLGWVPPAIRRPIGVLLRTLPPAFWDSLACAVPAQRRPRAVADKVARVARALTEGTPDFIYKQLISYWNGDRPVVKNGATPDTILDDRSLQADVPAFLARMQFLDLVTYLPDDILAKVDRASMGVSLEARVPLLDHRVVEFAWRIPLAFRVRSGHGKWILRRVLERYVPSSLFERPKSGFSVPVGAWLRGPLREWAQELIDPRRIAEEGYLDPDLIHAKWMEHLSGKKNWEYHLWGVLMFQAWLRRWT